MPFIKNFKFFESFKLKTSILSDHIYKMHYGEMLSVHKNQKNVTIAVMPAAPKEEASRFGIMNVDEEGTITDFEENPAEPLRESFYGHRVFTYLHMKCLKVFGG